MVANEVEEALGIKTLILGMGNPILSDDGVGLRVINSLNGQLKRPGITVMESSTGGLRLLDLLAGYDRAIIVDAIQTATGKVGQVYRLRPEAFDGTRHATNPHDISFSTALELGKKLGVPLPRHITVFAIEVEDVLTFGEQCTPEVEQAIPVAADMVEKELLS